MRVKQILGGLLNYLAAVGLAVVFALFLSGRIGWFLVLAFLCAPIISLLMTLPFKNRIYVTVSAGAASLCKGDTCEVTVTVSNGCCLPSPPICIDVLQAPGAVCSDRKLSLSVMPFSEETFELRYTAVICGPCSVGVGGVKLTDYFGLFSFTPGCLEESELTGFVGIIPDIADIKTGDTVVRQAMEMSAAADDSEDTAESPVHTFGGFPGYDSREYVPGDPLKRINWKQSAKRGKLLVRLDDETACSSVSVVLDSVFTCDVKSKQHLAANPALSMYSDSELFPAAAQYAVEYSLGAARIFLRQGYSVTFMTMGENGWQSISLSDESDLPLVCAGLAMYRFSKDADISRFPAQELSEQKGTVSIYCTPYFDSGLYSVLSEFMGADSKGALKTAVMAAAAEDSVREQLMRGSVADGE